MAGLPRRPGPRAARLSTRRAPMTPASLLVCPAAAVRSSIRYVRLGRTSAVVVGLGVPESAPSTRCLTAASAPCRIAHPCGRGLGGGIASNSFAGQGGQLIQPWRKSRVPVPAGRGTAPEGRLAATSRTIVSPAHQPNGGGGPASGRAALRAAAAGAEGLLHVYSGMQMRPRAIALTVRTARSATSELTTSSSTHAPPTRSPPPTSRTMTVVATLSPAWGKA